MSALCIHGRQREQREHDGPADWEALRHIKRALRVPVISNGSIQNRAEAVTCLEYTGVDAVMAATGLLRNPSLFSNDCNNVCTCHLYSAARETTKCGSVVAAIENCRDYLRFARLCWSKNSYIAVNGKSKEAVVRCHLQAILQPHLMDIHLDIWSFLGSNAVNTLEQFSATLDVLINRVLPSMITSASILTLHNIKLMKVSTAVTREINTLSEAITK